MRSFHEGRKNVHEEDRSGRPSLIDEYLLTEVEEDKELRVMELKIRT